jgi:hypothetical protein
MPSPPHGAWSPGRTTLACLLLTLAGLAFLLAEHWYLEGRRQDSRAARARQAQAQKVEAARAALAAGRPEEAIALLEAVQAAAGADRDVEGEALLYQARQKQAEALFRAAGAALARKDGAAAGRLLRAYLAHPQAAERGGARALLAELDLAQSQREAKAVLARLSDAELLALAGGGELPGHDRLRTPGARELFKDTVRRSLAGEQWRREERRRAARLARARLEGGLRRTPAFDRLLAFTADVRRRLAEEKALAARQEQALARLFEQVEVAGTAERQRIRARLHPEGSPRRQLAARVARQRTESKRDFRSSGRPGLAEAALFDELVDRELDALLAQIKGP